MSKTYFGNLDCRNIKYQGKIKDQDPDGLGILLNQQYLWCLSTWDDKYQPNNKTIIVFPDRSLFYGELNQGKLGAFWCYQSKQNVKIYGNQSNVFLVVLKNKQTVIKIQKNQDEYSIIKQIQHIDQKAKWQTISQILKYKNFQLEYSSLIKYVSTHLCQIYRQIDCQQIIGKGFFIGFKQATTLGVRYDIHQKVKEVGIFNEARKIDFGRKYHDLSVMRTKVQQGNFHQYQKLQNYYEKRSQKALKLTQQYFKKSTNFKNIFIKIDFISFLSDKLNQINQGIQNLEKNNFGQILFHNTHSINNQSQKTKKYTLQEIRKDIYKAIQKKSTTNLHQKNTKNHTQRKNISMKTQYYQEKQNSSQFDRYLKKNIINQFKLFPINNPVSNNINHVFEKQLQFITTNQYEQQQIIKQKYEKKRQKIIQAQIEEQQAIVHQYESIQKYKPRADPYYHKNYIERYEVENKNYRKSSLKQPHYRRQYIPQEEKKTVQKYQRYKQTNTKNGWNQSPISNKKYQIPKQQKYEVTMQNNPYNNKYQYNRTFTNERNKSSESKIPHSPSKYQYKQRTTQNNKNRTKQKIIRSFKYLD